MDKRKNSVSFAIQSLSGIDTLEIVSNWKIGVNKRHHWDADDNRTIWGYNTLKSVYWLEPDAILPRRDHYFHPQIYLWLIVTL